MSRYRNILIAVDLTESASIVIEKALQVSDQHNVKIVILHVIDYIPYMGYGEGALINPTYNIPRDDMLDNARTALDNILSTFKINNLDLKIEFGVAANEVVRIADQKQCDLIVIGSHGRHGVKLLLGSSANAVLHHAHCDVLAVRIND